VQSKVAILGRGMAVINAAPELIERGFEVAGGKGRRIHVYELHHLPTGARDRQ